MSFYTVIFGDDHDMILVAEEFEGDYDWEEVKVFYSPSKRRFFWLYDEGGSMDEWGEDSDLSDFKNGLKDDVLRDLKKKEYYDAWEGVRAFRYRKEMKRVERGTV